MTSLINFIKKCLSSRKFMLAFGSILISLGTAVQGSITWDKAVFAIVLTVLGYVGVEGSIDYQRAKLGK